MSLNSISITTTSSLGPRVFGGFKLKINRATLKPKPFLLHSSINSSSSQKSSVVVQTSLRILEWDKVCDCVASYAGTLLGQQATKEHLWKLNQSYHESKTLLAQTSAAVQMLNYGACGLDFSAIDVLLVKSAIQNASRGLPVEGKEAMAVASLFLFSEALQSNVKAACKEDSDWYNRFMPLTKMVMELFTNQPLVNSIRQVIDDDGSVKDSASPNLKRFRDQVRRLEGKLFQLMDSLVRKELDKTSSLEVSTIDGRWCIKSGFDQLTTVNGLLLSSGSGVGSLVEPLSAVPLNDELQQARASVAMAEEDVLLRLTEKMRADLDGIRDLLDTIVQLDMITARAKYSLSFGGTFPDLLLTEDKDAYISGEYDASGKRTLNDDLSTLTERKWILYLPKAYHPILLQQHQQNLKKARKNVKNAIADIRRRKLQPENVMLKGKAGVNIESLEMEVTKLEQARPVPVDFFIGTKTKVLIITGPNTGGKTICLKTIGLAAMMAKSGLYVLSSEPVRIPWFDSIFADIGDDQSLSQSLSTFSGHLRQISFLLKLLIAGYSSTFNYNDTIENACMEFDEVNLRPTYKILWGVPGRSNAINIAERLGLPDIVVDNARELYGTASAEINEVIIEMERFKQEYQEHVHKAHHYLTHSGELHEKLLAAKEKISEHRISLKYRMMKEISEVATIARSTLHKRLRQLRASISNSPQGAQMINSPKNIIDNKQYNTAEEVQQTISHTNKLSVEQEQPKKSTAGVLRKVPNVGDIVYVASLGKKVTVLKVEASKEEIVVQASNMKLRLKLRDLQT
ncbi:endonuclease MutS2-like [Thalictrum thalictroides]|uniref:Endonuclease MutS2-like n=1 Tax=Thalictrum thalictroides TaxID=46969 RepID=A0A7J6X4I1_THATH|nr:endonuclease MutS2-like [Thalictrum thalictroides]